MKNIAEHYSILVINPGSTSTKLALFRDHVPLKEKTIYHPAIVHKRRAPATVLLNRLADDARSFVNSCGIDELSAVAARGGLLRPLCSGVYRVNGRMLGDLQRARFGRHASNLGAPCAAALAARYGCPAYIVDPVAVDEMNPETRITGIPEIRRRSVFHALNQKSSARKIAARLGKKYESCNFIVAHMGGGISVGAHCRGRVIDVNNALDGDGPFSPERSGGIPAGDLLRLFSRHRGSFDAFYNKIVGRGGLSAWCGTSDLRAIERKIGRGNTMAKLVMEGMIHCISKEIAMHGATLHGKIDAIILTGGMANDRKIISGIKKRVSFLAPICVIPGEGEMEALADGVLSVLKAEEKWRRY